MSSHYESLQQDAAYAEGFGVQPPLQAGPKDIWPRKIGHFIRLSLRAPEGSPERDDKGLGEGEGEGEGSSHWASELCAGQFGLVPAWVKSASDAKLRSPKLVNARHETVSTSNNFRDAWLQGDRKSVV